MEKKYCFNDAYALNDSFLICQLCLQKLDVSWLYFLLIFFQLSQFVVLVSVALWLMMSPRFAELSHDVDALAKLFFFSLFRLWGRAEEKRRPNEPKCFHCPKVINAEHYGTLRGALLCSCVLSISLMRKLE